MAEVVSCEWLLEHVGKPSNSFGSTYTKIFEAMEVWEKTKTDANLVCVGKLTMAWCQSKHKGAKSDTEKDVKEKQQLSINRFASFLSAKLNTKNLVDSRKLLLKMESDDKTYPKEKQIIEQVIDDMAKGPAGILKNTGAKLIGTPLVMDLKDNFNGSYGLNKLTLNPVLAYHRSELQGRLVHECHHMLCTHNGNYTYLDEFAAHVKQYTLTRPKMTEDEMITIVNKSLDCNYSSIVGRWTKPVAEHGMGMRRVTKFTDLGDFAVPDNANLVKCSEHGCQPI